MNAPLCSPARPVTRRPSWRLPPGTTDCHFHIFGPDATYGFAEARSYTPPEASVADYDHLCATLGIERAVIVHPSPYGFDTSRTLSAMTESGVLMRAVLVLEPSVTEAELQRYHALGARGVRLNLLFGAGTALEDAERLADKIRPFGWHMQFLTDVSTAPDLAGLVERVRVPVVFDHLGHVSAAKGASNPGFRRLTDLVREGRAWVKLSGTYRVTARTTGPYEDARPFVDALVAANPQQLVWGTDWPHPSLHIPMPDDTDLVDSFGEWIGDAAVREAILVRNPERLYGFAPA